MMIAIHGYSVTGTDGNAQVRLPPQPLQLALWTDRPGYRAGETVRLFLTLDPHDDKGSYWTSVWLERAGVQDRQYLAALSAGVRFHAEAVDVYGRNGITSAPVRHSRADSEMVWEGPAPEPGLWQFVLEMRPASPFEQVGNSAERSRTRRAWARFVVAERSQLLSRHGFDREILSDLTLRSDTLYYLGHQLFVHDGATLTIEAGTLIQAWGRNSAIIVEPGGKIVAQGAREAPVVLTCAAPVGQREPGCWGGLWILGGAPVTRLVGVAPGVLPAGRPVYGGADPEDSSGILQYLRVEFAGAAGDGESAVPAIGLYGAGRGTVIDHVQAHASLGVGIAFSGGTVGCRYCVASGSGAAGLAWERGWRGSASHIYVQHARGGSDGIDGAGDERGWDLEPRSLPFLANATLLHSYPHGLREREGVGLRLRTGSGVVARDILVSDFVGGALFAGPRATLLFEEGVTSVVSSLFHRGSVDFSSGPVRPTVDSPGIQFVHRPAELRDVRWFANPDPRPKASSAALKEENGEGEGAAVSEYMGAFGKDENWLEGWTVFGAEYDYEPRTSEESP